MLLDSTEDHLHHLHDERLFLSCAAGCRRGYHVDLWWRFGRSKDDATDWSQYNDCRTFAASGFTLPFHTQCGCLCMEVAGFSREALPPTRVYTQAADVEDFGTWYVRILTRVLDRRH